MDHNFHQLFFVAILCGRVKQVGDPTGKGNKLRTYVGKPYKATPISRDVMYGYIIYILF